MLRFLSMIMLMVASTFFLMSFQEEDHAVNPEIPELKEMHHVIRPMWHDAYPDKDIDMLKNLYPDLVKNYQNLKDADFPEQWPDREMHWNEGVSEMGNTLKEYQDAMEKNKSEALLAAARKLHDDFENLVMIINPPIPELDAFHKILFHVYHDYLPEKDWAKVQAAVPRFQEKLEALQSVELPSWMKDRQEAFNQACDELEKSIEKLARLNPGDKAAQWENAVEKVHSAYVKVEASLE